jgi:hypothetical protein
MGVTTSFLAIDPILHGGHQIGKYFQRSSGFYPRNPRSVFVQPLPPYQGGPGGILAAANSVDFYPF